MRNPGKSNDFDTLMIMIINNIVDIAVSVTITSTFIFITVL